MQLKFFKILFILLLTQTLAGAQQMCSFQVCVQNVKVEQINGQLHLRLDVDVAHAKVPTRQALVLTPVVRVDNNVRTLPPIVIQGKNRRKANKRTAYFGDTIAYPKPYLTLKSGNKADTIIPYIYELPNEPWMKDARLALQEQMHGCAGCKDSVNNILLTPEKFRGKPALSYIVPKVEPVKNRNMVGKAFLDFPVGESVILADFHRNFQELSKIFKNIEQLRTDPNTDITRIILRGYASPEDSYAINASLSEERMRALKRYLQHEYRYPNNLFDVASQAEDWKGLRKLIQNSTLPERQAVLNIIDEHTGVDMKEHKLKMLNNGSVFAVLMHEYFPKLRRVDYTLHYTIRAFSVEEGKKMVKTNPGQLSLNELFLVANTYPKGSPDFNQVFDVAVRLYPTDTIANINAAAIALGKGNLEDAHHYLDPYQTVPYSWNNQGSLYLLEGNEIKAKEFFEKAQVEGSKEAEENLEKIKKSNFW